jgi:hypothetical protein
VGIDKQTALDQIDAVFSRRQELVEQWCQPQVCEMITLECAAIRRLAPPGSAYVEQMDAARQTTRRVIGSTPEEVIEESLQGVLRALRADYEAHRLETFQELVHADLFSDFLEMADHLLQEGFKDPAAVLAGGVLEEHLRKLCEKQRLPLSGRPKLDKMNADLAKAAAYGKNDQKQITAWAGIRNDAAHANYGNYEKEAVGLMVMGIRDFINRYPA